MMTRNFEIGRGKSVAGKAKIKEKKNRKGEIFEKRAPEK